MTQTIQRIEKLWDQTEQMIHNFFQSYLKGAQKKGKNDPDKLPKMTDFNVITAAIKRVQEARLSLIKEELQYETLSGTNPADSEGAEEEISRILKALEKNGACEKTDPDQVPE